MFIYRYIIDISIFYLNPDGGTAIHLQRYSQI